MAHTIKAQQISPAQTNIMLNKSIHNFLSGAILGKGTPFCYALLMSDSYIVVSINRSPHPNPRPAYLPEKPTTLAAYLPAPCTW